jgi:hypothetical protein
MPYFSALKINFSNISWLALCGLGSYALNKEYNLIEKIKVLNMDDEGIAALERNLICPKHWFRFEISSRHVYYGPELFGVNRIEDLDREALGEILDPNFHIEVCRRYCDKEKKYEWVGFPAIIDKYYYTYDTPKWSKMYVYYIFLKQDCAKETKLLNIRENEEEINKMFDEEFIPLRNKIIEDIRSKYKKSIIPGLLMQAGVIINTLFVLYCINH